MSADNLSPERVAAIRQSPRQADVSDVEDLCDAFEAQCSRIAELQQALQLKATKYFEQLEVRIRELEQLNAGLNDQNVRLAQRLSTETEDVPADTGHPEADRLINRLSSSDPDFDDCTDACVLIRKLVVEHRGPDGFATWKDAAIAERMKRASLPPNDDFLGIVKEISTMDCFYTGAQCAPDCQCIVARACRATQPSVEPEATPMTFWRCYRYRNAFGAHCGAENKLDATHCHACGAVREPVETSDG